MILAGTAGRYSGAAAVLFGAKLGEERLKAFADRTGGLTLSGRKWNAPEHGARPGLGVFVCRMYRAAFADSIPAGSPHAACKFQRLTTAFGGWMRSWF